ncbi:MAG: MutS-related protein [Thermosulfidibacteraceae bacterium]
MLLSQIGSFVPAKEVFITPIDRILTRIGAADYLVKGLSTFMVEIVETANIFKKATSKSPVILGEVGRGTSTYDGLSIAWAVLEHLRNETRTKVLLQLTTMS